MKNIFLLSICSAFLLLSCKKESRPFNYRYALAQNSVWTTEDFKTHYTIQFPTGFIGGIQRVSVGGNVFCKYNSTDSLYYAFEDAFMEFGDFDYPVITIDTTITEIVDKTYPYHPNSFNIRETVTLTSRVDFVQADSLVGMFFYTDYNPKSAGILYWKDKNEYDTKAVFKKALFAYYKKENLPTLIEIMRTIKKI